MRVLNNLPVFFFAPGHAIKVIPELNSLALKWYYSDNKPPYIDLHQTLDCDFLLEQAQNQGQVTVKMRENFYHLPSPVGLVERFLNL